MKGLYPLDLNLKTSIKIILVFFVFLGVSLDVM